MQSVKTIWRSLNNHVQEKHDSTIMWTKKQKIVHKRKIKECVSAECIH